MPCGSNPEERPLRMMPLRVSIPSGFLGSGKTTLQMAESGKKFAPELTYGDPPNPTRLGRHGLFHLR